MSHQNLVDDVIEAISVELSMPKNELDNDELSWVELGIDPIIERTISAALQRIEQRLENDIFQRFPDVGSLKQHVLAVSLQLSYRDPDPQLLFEGGNGEIVPSTVLIQDSSAASDNPKILFLLPDGSGSAMAYARLRIMENPPSARSGTKIIALNSPFMLSAHGYTCSIEQLAAAWSREILRIQPSGPYLLGGWSAGGFYAYEVMKALRCKGHLVDKLILIDSPCRTDFGALPVDVLRYLANHGLLGNGGNRNYTVPRWLVHHFEATLRAVDQYNPTAYRSKQGEPEVFIIWATDPLFSSQMASQTGLDLDIKVSRFLLVGRSDFGPNGWNKLLPGAKIHISKAPGNHFNLVHPPHVEYLSSLISDVLEDDITKKRHVWL